MGRPVSVGRSQREHVRRFVLFVALLLPLAALPAPAQWKETTSVKGKITAIEPDGFDVAGYHVILGANTEMVTDLGPKKSGGKLKQLIVVGTFVHAEGTIVHGESLLIAEKLSIRDDADRMISGVGIIDRVLSSGPDAVFRADGYVLRVNPSTELKFSAELTGLSQVGTNMAVRYEGKRTDNGEILLSRAEFRKLKAKAPKDAGTVWEMQAIAFPPGTKFSGAR